MKAELYPVGVLAGSMIVQAVRLTAYISAILWLWGVI